MLDEDKDKIPKYVLTNHDNDVKINTEVFDEEIDKDKKDNELLLHHEMTDRLSLVLGMIDTNILGHSLCDSEHKHFDEHIHHESRKVINQLFQLYQYSANMEE